MDTKEDICSRFGGTQSKLFDVYYTSDDGGESLVVAEIKADTGEQAVVIACEIKRCNDSYMFAIQRGEG